MPVIKWAMSGETVRSARERATDGRDGKADYLVLTGDRSGVQVIRNPVVIVVIVIDAQHGWETAQVERTAVRGTCLLRIKRNPQINEFANTPSAGIAEVYGAGVVVVAETLKPAAVAGDAGLLNGAWVVV